MNTNRPLRKPNQDYRSREFLYLSEVNTLIECAESGRKHRLRNSTLVLIIFRHGLRATECSNLKWDAISIPEKTIFINRAKNGVCGTHNLEDDEIEKLKQLKENATSPYIFIGENGEKLSSAAIAKIIKRLGVAAELGFPVHAHQLRHACGYHLARLGKASYLIQSHLGHRNYKNTEIYIHWAGIPRGSINWSEQ
jgi:type 1 fimbriae regulatory protein FimB/type 1 fimbriae regulatory protein FimE